MAWEIKGTTGSLESFPHVAYQSRVSAPKNPKLIREIRKPKKLTPSEFLREMSMDTKQKLANTHEMHLPRIIELLDMGETSLQKSTELSVDEPMFQPYPSEIYFQKFDAFGTYEVPLLLRNNDKVPRLVKVTQLDTPYFKILTSADAHQKVGPGLPIIYRIQFQPEENRDYNHELIVTTEREKFIIPIKCIGARAILDFPDQINFSTCPVKNLNSKVLLIRNVGNKDAKFSLKTEKPFSVSPDHGILPIGENMQVTVDFQPQKSGEFSKDLTISYESCETLYVSLYGAAQDINVRLEKSNAQLEETYITMTNQQTLTLYNNSDVIVNYEWKKFATSIEEDHQRLREVALLNKDEENVKNKLAGVVQTKPDHLALLSRNFKNKLRTTQNKSFRFEDPVFEIEPIEGEIWPHSTTTVNIIFKPDAAQTYLKTAFCEITGRESRLPLRLSGVGLGPRVQLSIEVLDVGSIFVGSSHVYEVVVANKGYIDAIFTVNIPPTTFGKCFQFEPNEGLISPGGYQAVNIIFTSSTLGEFDETFEFAIDGNPDKFKLVIKGIVIPPSFTFDVPKLKFGLVSYGFEYSQTCILANTSLVPMTYNLRVASDCELDTNTSPRKKVVSSISLEEDSAYNFKEFSITPSTGLIPAQSQVKLHVKFVPHFIKKYDTALLLDIDEIGLSELFSLPITARSIVPQISLITSMIDMGRRFIFHAYENVVRLGNDTALKARYKLLLSGSPDTDSITFTSPQAEGVIEPNSVKEIRVMASAVQLGDIACDLLIGINGSVEPPLRCNFICFSQGPVVQIYPKNIDWGLTTVLLDSSREITLSNESLIEARFSSIMTKRNSPWRVEPPSGVLAPGSEMTIRAVCYLIDKMKYDDTINIEIENSHTQRIGVRAQGAGSSIVSEPNIGNLVDFGTSFSGGLVTRVFNLTNKSSRQQNLSFQLGESTRQPNLVQSKKEAAAAREKLKISPPTIFKVSPIRLELAPGETKEIMIEGFGDKPQLVEEQINCYSIIGRTTGKDRVMKFKVRCEFIAPLVSFSTRDLLFRCEHDGSSGLPPNQIKHLTISNISSLDLTAQMSTQMPFSLIDEETGNLAQEMIVNLKTGQSLHLGVNFDTRFKEDLHNQVINGQLVVSYAEHQEKDYVNLISEIYFPNLYFEATDIDFGCILNYTETQRNIKMTNIGPLIVNYKWKFILEKDNVVFNRPIELMRNEQEQSSQLPDIRVQEEDDEMIAAQQSELFTADESQANELKQEQENKPESESQHQEQPKQEQQQQQQQNTDDSKKLKRNKLQEIMMNNSLNLALPSIEEIFDISPLYGSLHPGESQELKITYTGHKEIKAYVRAVCEVRNGPTYELMLRGEASTLDYEISTRFIDFGCIPFDEISDAQLEIRNLGKVTIKYSMIENEAVSVEENYDLIEPNKPAIFPPVGLIEAEKTATILVRYWPGVPKLFKKTFQLQISHFAPEEITIQGDAGFADIMLDLPRFENESYAILRKEAKAHMTTTQEKEKDKQENEYVTSELELQLEIDRLSIQNFVKATNPSLIQYLSEPSQEENSAGLIVENKITRPLSHQPKQDNNIKDMNISTIDMTQSKIGLEKSSMLDLTTGGVNEAASHRTNGSIKSSSSANRKRSKPILPDYILDFGHVILGTVKTHVIRAVNMGRLLASFEIERQNYLKTGFLIDLEKVKNLPTEETVEFVVTFDPRGANLSLGPVEHVIPLNIVNGPTVNIRLKANVTMPDMQISSDVVEFAEVKCGECKIITVQLNNHKEVRCDWFASYLPKRDEKFTPLHLKRMKKLNGETNKPKIFEIMPASGILMPGQKANIQIKFMPTEEKNYEERVTIRMNQSSQRLMILCKGKGSEPRVEISKNSIEFEPILPHSVGDEQEVKITNPCSFPIEIYNLEFDKSYLDEEKILRIVKGYDEYNTVLLPPRAAGEKLPNEFYEYYEEQLKKLEEEEKKQKPSSNLEVQTESGEAIRQQVRSAGTEATKSKSDEASGTLATGSNNNQQQSNSQSQSQQQPKSVGGSGGTGSGGVGELVEQRNPVLDSIARYLGIDLSTEGRAARNRRGVAMVVHGPPLSGKSRAAVALAKHYECALLTLDAIITDAIATSTSASAQKARQLCAEAAQKYAEEQRAIDAATAVDMARANAAAAGTGAASAAGNVAGANMAAATGGGLSAEALAQHTITQGGVLGGSKKTSVAGDSHSNVKSKKAKGAGGDNSNADQSSTHPSTPPPLQGPIARKLSISTNLYTQDDGYMSTVLPEDVIVDLLNERFQLSDCNRGVVIDGLETLFAQNYLLAATAVLKSFNNRRYIYFVSMKSDFQKYKEQLARIQEEKLKAKKEKELMDQIFLEEMNEETYNNLPAEKRKEIDDKLQQTKKLRLKREAEERAEKERIERELAEQQARLEEEKKKKKKTLGGKELQDKKAVLPGGQLGKLAPVKEVPSKEAKTTANPTHPATEKAGSDRPHTRVDGVAGSTEDSEKGKKVTKVQQPVPHEEDLAPKIIDPEEEKRREAERLLQQRFKTFDVHFKDICALLEAWDRTQGNIFRQSSPSDKSELEDHLTTRRKLKDLKNKKEREKAEAAAAKVAEQQKQQLSVEEGNEKDENSEQASNIPEESSRKPNDVVVREEPIGVPHIVIENVNKSDLDEVYKHPKLPPIEEVLDGMGLGPKGPPIPPPAIFAVVPYPTHRKSPPGSEFSHYLFVTTNENDPNLIPDDKSKDSAANYEGALEGEKTPDIAHPKTSKTRGTKNTSRSESKADGRRTSASGTDGSKKLGGRAESRLKKGASGGGSNAGGDAASGGGGGSQSPNRNSSALSQHPNLSLFDQFDGSASLEGGMGGASSTIEKPSQKLQRFRWVIAPGSEIILRMRFTSDECGQFDQTLNFEIVGTRRRYQLHCRGVCTFPTISREPRVVFPSRKKARETPNEIVHKKYILSEDLFEFGPLLIGNNRDRVREGKFPDYMEILNIQNVSPLDTEINFCFLEEANDKSEPCFYLEPGELTLKPNEVKQLKIFATPKDIKLYSDTLICCIKENPEPVTFKISCLGQKPELALDKREFNFKQVLLHRKDSKEIKMLNNTMIPVQWKIEGVDSLGEEFVCNQTSGIIEPLSSFNLLLHFRALRPIVITPKDKKILKLLVSSVNSFLGFIENHTITVTAEAYDVALEINLPKGNDGGLEFGNVRVGVEAKLQCTLRNKGKYPIRFNFLTEATTPESRDVLKYLSLQPASGELPSMYDRSSQNQTIQVSMNAKKEISIRDEPILKCQVIDPSVSESNGVIANIPIKVSVKVWLSKFSITPQSEINFGSMLVNSKRQERMIIENKGEFDFKFSINKLLTEANKNQAKKVVSLTNLINIININEPDNKTSRASTSRTNTKLGSAATHFKRFNSHLPAPREVVQNQGRLQFGPYTITPATGLILPSGHQVITIDCVPEYPGRFDEELVIDITDRDVKQYPNGIQYKISAEAIYPNISNSIEIFEEHTIIPNASVLDAKTMGVGIYAEEENKFFFNNVIVGRTAKARFKLLNTNKIPIDLNMSLKSSTTSIANAYSSKTPLGNRSTNPGEAIFDLDPVRIHIAPHSYGYTTVSFTPSSIATYGCQFEATLENLPANMVKQRSVSFELTGDGTLPRFSIVRPTVRNRTGQTLMLFKRTVVGNEDTQSLVLTNDGTLAAKVNFFLIDPDGSFRIRPAAATASLSSAGSNKNERVDGVVMKDNGSVSSVIIQPGSQAAFQVTCSPRAVQAYNASLQITVTDNQFEDTLVQLIGEGYLEDVTLDNLPNAYLTSSLASPDDPEASDLLAEEDVAALKATSIHFGDCYVNERKQLLFTLKNMSKTQCYRFEWAQNQQQQQPSTTAADQTTAAASLSSLVQFSPRVGHLHAGGVKDITVTFKSSEPRFLRKEIAQCLLTKIAFDQPIDEVKDWDDRMTLVKWINDVVVSTVGSQQQQPNATGGHHENVPITTTTGPQASHISVRNSIVAGTMGGTTTAASLAPPAQTAPAVQTVKQIVKKKVVEVEPEPKYTKLEDSVAPLELLLNANCDYCRYRCRVNAIRFKDTLMFQTRVFEVPVINRGKIGFDFNWQVQMEDSRRPFTPLIPPETPTPEDRSLSPVGGRSISKASKGTSATASGGAATESSASQGRKAQGGKDAAASKDSKKDGGGKQAAKKSTSKTAAAAAAAAAAATAAGGKQTKDSKGANTAASVDKDPLDETLTRPSLFDFSASLKVGEETRPDSQAQMRAESALSVRPPSSIGETGYVPFSVEPAFGRCEPGKTIICKVKFSPLNVNDYQARLLCHIDNTEDGKFGPVVAVKGRGLLPYCHFELEESDYLTSGRRNPDLPGPSGAASGLGLEPTTKVIEFNCVGLGEKENRNKIVRKFEIINPTNVDYEFEWVREEQNDGKRHDQFTCLHPKGRILSGRKYDLGFVFEPDEIGIKETFWRFRIPKYDLSVPFLLVGNATEPKVIFDRAHVSFKPLLVGRTAYETVYLINQESITQRFEFDQTSCYTEGRSAVVLVDPFIGELAPQSRTPIALSFNAKEQHACVFNLKCHIVGASQHKSLNLNVKGEGFRIATALQCEDAASGERVEFLHTNLSEIHMGEVEKNETSFRNLYVTNQGKHRVKFEWALTSESREALECFSIEPQIDLIEPGDRKHCILRYVAKIEKPTICSLALKIENGPIYHIHVDGIAVKPDLHFSPSVVDFGERFTFRPGMKPHTTILTLTNRGQKDLNVSCLSELSSQSAFAYEFKQVILAGKKSAQCSISFLPREAKMYEEKLVFELNGLTKREVRLCGLGTNMRVELVDPKNKLFDLGTLQIGKVSKKTLQLINRSTIPVDFNLVLEPKCEQLHKDRSILSVTPTQNLHLAPNETLEVAVRFAPKSRIQRFAEELGMDANGVSGHVGVLQGACHGYSIWLESNTLPFGAVAQRCSTIKRIVMHNDGDIGASFKWDVERLKPEFTIYPTYGYISPGMEVCFDVTFNPAELGADIRKEGVRCVVEGLSKPLTLNLTGSCVQIAPQKESINFEASVRTRESKQITITNRTNSSWELKPLIEGEFFSGLESFVIEPQSSASYEVVYHPLTMTSVESKQKHIGSVFFPLPDGTGLMYMLTGVANPPKHIARVLRENIPCKTNHVEVLSIENWLKKPQRFKVTFESSRPDRGGGGEQQNWSLKGNDYLDVPGNGKKEYKVTFYAHKESTAQTKVVFRNETTGEYCFYELTLKAVRGGSLGTIELFTQVRVLVGHSMRLENPLGVAATFTATCTNAHEILLPTSVTIPARSQGEFAFEYLPMRSGESSAKLEINSAELGSYLYDLKLRAALAPHERAIYFRAHLGQSQTVTAKFTNFCRQKADYSCKVDNTDFKADKSIAAAPSQTPSGIEVSFDITFEPSSIGEFKSTLVLFSQIGGEYVFPLHATCLAPKPQGPYQVKANGTTSIAFKNVFSQPLAFSFAIDNQLFSVNKTTEVIKAHQTYKIVVGFDGNDSSSGSKADVMAKLVVTAAKSAGTSNHVQWVYYLRGTS